MQTAPSSNNSVLALSSLAADVATKVPSTDEFNVFFAILNDGIGEMHDDIKVDISALIKSAVACCYTITSHIEVAKTAFHVILEGIKKKDAKGIRAGASLLERSLVEPAKQMKVIGDGYLRVLGKIKSLIELGQNKLARKETWMTVIRVTGVVLGMASVMAPLAAPYIHVAHKTMAAVLSVLQAIAVTAEAHLLDQIDQIQGMLEDLSDHEVNMQEQHSIWQELQQQVAQFNLDESRLQEDVLAPELEVHLPNIQKNVFEAVKALSNVSLATAKFMLAANEKYKTLLPERVTFYKKIIEMHAK